MQETDVDGFCLYRGGVGRIVFVFESTTFKCSVVHLLEPVERVRFFGLKRFDMI